MTEEQIAKLIAFALRDILEGEEEFINEDLYREEKHEDNR